MIYIAYTSAPLDFLANPVTFDAGGPTTLVGATVRVDAINDVTKAKTAGTATVVDADTCRCTFAAGTLPAGRYDVQLLATISGVSQVICASLWTVRPGAAP